MAELLGSDVSLDSLKEDISDVEATIGEYISRLGPLSCPSWKYPSKQAGDINIEQLLVHYLNFPNLPHDSQKKAKQIAHIAFYDLLIDRMVYLLHASSEFSKILLKTITKRKNTIFFSNISIEAGNNSVGLVARRSWLLHEFMQKSLLQLSEELKNEKKHVAEKVNKNEASPRKSVVTRPQSSLSVKHTSPDGSLYSSISKDVCLKSTQTVETAFVPCESCSAIQRSFKKSAFSISKMCQNLNLPSNVNKLIAKSFEDDCWMSFNEITKYSYEQEKDVCIICRHIEMVVAESESQKAETALLEKKYKSLENHQITIEKKLVLEEETQFVLQKHHQTKLKEMCGVKIKLEDQMKTIRNELKSCCVELTKEEQNTQDLKSINAQLTEELKKQTEAAEKKEKFMVEVSKLRSENIEFSKKTVEWSKELAREQAKSKSILKCCESMEKKQNLLLERVEKLSEENSKLHDQIADLLDDTDENQEKYEELLQEKLCLQKQLKDKEVKHQQLSVKKKEIEKLLLVDRSKVEELSEELKKIQERESLLVQYPDLNGPVLSDNLCSGHLEKEMYFQLKSNVTRIELLENQNLVLRNALEKINSNSTSQSGNNLLLTHLRDSKKTKSDSEVSFQDSDMEIFKNGSVSDRKHNYQQYNQQNRDKHSHLINKEENDRSIIDYYHNENFEDYDPVLKNIVKNNQALDRSQSSNISNLNQAQQSPQTKRPSSSIQIDKTLKQQGKIHARNLEAKSTDRSHVKRTPPSSTHVCKNCDKMYLLERELTIHYLYCKS